MTYARALDTPLRMQWDDDSRLPYPDPGVAGGNCGPTCVVMVVEFYRDTKYGIYATRRLVVTHLGLYTGVTDQLKMMQLRGVAAQLKRPTISQLTAILSTGRQPVILGLDMSKVPYSIAGHDFRQSHAICFRANAVRNGVPGKLGADPNFSRRTNRLDPTGGKRFYPDYILQNAYYNANKWAIVPNSPKLVAPGPAPQPQPPTSGDSTGDGDPYPMRMRSLIGEDGVAPSYRLRAGKPIRTGYLTSNGVWTTVPAETRFRAVSLIDKDDLPLAERVYGDVFVIMWYQTNGDHFGYIKYADIA